jgi:hypothetical protein
LDGTDTALAEDSVDAAGGEQTEKWLTNRPKEIVAKNPRFEAEDGGCPCLQVTKLVSSCLEALMG